MRYLTINLTLNDKIDSIDDQTLVSATKESYEEKDWVEKCECMIFNPEDNSKRA